MITGDRGLCGSYNTQIIKKAEARAAKIEEQGVEVELILVGDKGQQYFSKRNILTHS